MSRGAIFLNMGGKHGAHLAVAVATLRERFRDPIALITEESGTGREHCELIASDDRLAPISVITDKDLRPGAHGQSYYCKTLLPRLSPFEQTIFFDADVLILGEIDELWPDQATGEVVLTQFADWISTGGKMRQRISQWGEVEPERMARMLKRKWPAINTGVMAWSTNSAAFCDDWNITTRKRTVFMADETAAQLIFPDHVCRIMDDRFNASVIFPRAGEDVLTRGDVRVLHGHGGKFWKRPQGRQLYLPHYERCLMDNLGGLRSIPPVGKWWQQVDEVDRLRLSRFQEFAKSQLVT